MEYKAEEVFAAAASLAARGWKVVKIYGLRDDLSCTCARGKSCPSAGKHPVEHEWQTHATDDENTIAGWFENINANVRWNIGVRLGPASGIIDVEADDENALRVMREFGLDRIDTTAYMGSRGPHYLFEYQEEMPASGVVKVDGLEVRIGGGEKGTQSVFPMSWHRTGVQYQWLPGRSPDDVPPARLPAKFLEKVFQKSRQGTGGAVAQAREVCAGGVDGEVQKVATGGRHAFLVGLASRYCWLIRPEYTEANKLEVIDWMLSQNDRHCVPPKSREEVVSIVNSQFDFYMTRAEERRARRPLERIGLVYNAETGEYEPGQWRLAVIHSDPKSYRLSILHPRVRGERVNVFVDAHTLRSSNLMADAILAATGSFNPSNPSKTSWAKTWDGESTREEGGPWRHTEGLLVRLLEDCEEEFPPAECRTYSRTAGYLLGYLKRFEASNSDDDELAESGTPKWIKNKRSGKDELLLKWESTWESVQKRWPFITNRDVVDLRRRLLNAVSPGLDRFQDRLETIGGHRSRWIVWTEDHLRALEKLSIE